jgi:hypothetical protein
MKMGTKCPVHGMNRRAFNAGLSSKFEGSAVLCWRGLHTSAFTLDAFVDRTNEFDYQTFEGLCSLN